MERSPRPARMVIAGVVGAVALGGGLGLWARPEPPAARAAPPADMPRPALQIVVDDTPAPLGPLLEVLPGDLPGQDPRAAAPPDPIVPRRPAAGLMKVDAVVAAEPLLAPAVEVEAAPKPAPPKPKPTAKPKAPKAETAKADPKLKIAKARGEKARVEKVRVEKAKTTEARKVIRARPEKATRLAKAETPKATKLVKADKGKAAKLAKVDPRKGRAEKTKVEKAKVEKAKAAPTRLATLVKAVKPAPRKLKAEAPKTRTAAARPKVPKMEKASIKPKPAAKAAARKPVPRGEGPMRVARNDTCASGDAGEAAVCGDRRLGARDRQLQQAYRNAEAAGVPASALRRQQTRWLQARAAAAREAPWAVEDVYEARISELNDLTRDAREN